MDQPKTIRSYRLVFRRRWRIFRIQGWRIPLPGGVELRLLAYWLGAVSALLILGALPLLGLLVTPIPPSLRYLALPLAAAWGLCRWEIDGRPPHRALLGLALWRLRPRELAGLRRVPALGTDLAPVDEVAIAADPLATSYPRARVRGPARLLLRYPARLERHRRRVVLRPAGAEALHKGAALTLEPGQRLEIAPP